MMLNRNRYIFYVLALLFLGLVAFWGCAVQQRPQGGPRDTTPPKLLHTIPENQTKNFRSKKILLEFDEYFKLNNQYQEISISPAQDRTPEYTIKQKTLQIELKDTLLPNTTYVINFGKAVVDVNEGNQVKNLTYVFSTGSKIDSLSISGSVTNALTHEKEKEISVLLFDLKQDSLLFGKKKPPLFAITDTAGNFKFSNLKADKYRIYAIKETAPDKIYNNDAELIAFKANPINLTKDTSGVNLTLFREVPSAIRFPNRAFDRDGSMLISTNRPLVKPSVKIISDALDAQKLVEINKTLDSINIYLKNMDFDSAKVAVLENGKALDTLTLRKGRRETFQQSINLSYNISQAGAIKPETDLIVKSNVPIESFDQQMITLMEDSARVNYTLQRDTSTRKRLILKYRWKPKVKYTLTFNDNAVTSFFGDKIKKTQKIFAVDNPENYSKFTVRIIVPDTSQSYIIELISTGENQSSVLRTNRIRRNTAITYPLLSTGKYQIRVTYDTNKNGKWDPGSLSLKTQPEQIWINPSVYSLRPNWEMEQDITIPAEPPPNP